jgi:DHA1 family bicyclomycin/chloramphenicol resistance-like MFS transporter
MNPDAHLIWRRPRWQLAALLAALGTLGPFSIDTYLPAFAGIAASLGATPAQMQQTLSAYLLGFAVMNLFHGAISDSVGRRPVVLWGLAVFTLASLGCALAQGIGQLVLFRGLQGMCAGAGMVVSRAIIRDMYPPDDAQRVMSQVTIYFGIAPAIAPIVGGWLFVHLGWHAIFWFLVAVGAALWLFNHQALPETLHPQARQPLALGHLLRGYGALLANRRFLPLSFASGVPFNGFFLYILASPVWLGEHLKLAPTQFFWLFCATISGIMLGAWWSGKLAGVLPPKRQVRRGQRIMIVATLLNLAVAFLLPPHPVTAIFPMALYAFGWALQVPVVTLMLLDLAPERRGMASSLQSCIGSLANALVAGLLTPLVMHSVTALALTSALLMLVGMFSWNWVKKHVA